MLAGGARAFVTRVRRCLPSGSLATVRKVAGNGESAAARHRIAGDIWLVGAALAVALSVTWVVSVGLSGLAFLAWAVAFTRVRVDVFEDRVDLCNGFSTHSIPASPSDRFTPERLGLGYASVRFVGTHGDRLALALSGAASSASRQSDAANAALLRLRQSTGSINTSS